MVYGTGRRALLDAAREAVEEHGADAVTTRDLCARAGVRAPTLYHHFTSKDGLLDALVAEAYARYRAGKAAVASSADAATDLRRGWDNHIAFARANHAVYPLMLKQGSEASTASLAELRDGFEQLAAAGALRDGVTAELATTVLSGALRGIAIRVSAAPGDPVVTAAADVLRDAVVARLLKGDEG